MSDSRHRTLADMCNAPATKKSPAPVVSMRSFCAIGITGNSYISEPEQSRGSKDVKIDIATDEQIRYSNFKSK